MYDQRSHASTSLLIEHCILTIVHFTLGLVINILFDQISLMAISSYSGPADCEKAAKGAMEACNIQYYIRK